MCVGLEEAINAPFGTRPGLEQPSLGQARSDAHISPGLQDCESAPEKGEGAIPCLPVVLPSAYFSQGRSPTGTGSTPLS